MKSHLSKQTVILLLVISPCNAFLQFDLSLRCSQLLIFIHFVIAPPEPIIGYAASSSCSLRGLNSVLFTTELSASGSLLGLTCDANKPHEHSYYLKSSINLP